MSDERFTLADRIGKILAESSKPGGWMVIHAGHESGPFSVAELIEKAGTAEVEPEDLVKENEGLWTKARDAAFLKEPFRLKALKQETIDKLGRFHGIWISKKAILIGGGVLLVLAAGLVVLAIRSFNQPQSGASLSISHTYAPPPKLDYDAIIRREDDFIRRNPMDVHAYHVRGFAWLGKNDPDSAILDFTEAIRFNREPAFSFINRGIAWGMKKDHDKAVADFTEAIRLVPNP